MHQRWYDRYLVSNLPLDHNGFSIELSSDGTPIVDYGFYPLAVIYNPNHQYKTKEKACNDQGELSPIASNVLDNFLSNANGLTIQDIFLQIQNENAKKEGEFGKREKQAEEELDWKNEEVKGFIERGVLPYLKW